MKKLLKFIIPALVFLLIIINLSFSDTNGVWHNCNDITGGVFGLDEQPIANYTFINPVNFKKEITANIIKSNRADGNVIIQLG